jgi:Family of unknown function (DUF6491)
MHKLLLTAAAAAILLSTPAVLATPAWADSCVRQDDIRNWTSLDDKSIVLENYHHDKVLLKLIGTCSGFKFHESLAIRSPGAMALSCVQRGDEIVTHDTGFRGSCTVISVTPYNGKPVKPTDSVDGSH